MQNSGWPCCCQIAMSAVFVCGASLENNRVFYPIARVVFFYFYSSWWCCCCCCCWWCSCFPPFYFLRSDLRWNRKVWRNKLNKNRKDDKNNQFLALLLTRRSTNMVYYVETLSPLKAKLICVLPWIIYLSWHLVNMKIHAWLDFSWTTFHPRTICRTTQPNTAGVCSTAVLQLLCYFWTYRVQLTIPK